MRKILKTAIIAVLAAFSIMSLSMTSYAADQGWKMEDGRWVYLDRNGEKVTSTFKASGSDWFYLGEDGELVKDELIEHNGNYYYLDASGVMKKNVWVELPNADKDEDFGDTAWYYLQASGKACIGGRKDINGQTYIFDDQGRLLYGWILQDEDGNYTMADKSDDSTQWQEALYYCGGEDDGAMVKGQWRRLRVYDPHPSSSSQDPGDCEYWFYFNSNGKKYRNEDEDKSYVQKTIGGYKYAFADDGHMLSEWVSEDADGGSEKYFSDPSSGAKVSKGWFKVVPTEKMDAKNSESGDNAAQWYYADSQGNLYKNAIKTINNKRYLFDKTGAMRAGLFYVAYSDDEISEIREIETVEGDGDPKALDTYTLPGTEYIPEGISDGTSAESSDETSAGTSDETSGSASGESRTGLYYFAPPTDSDGSMQTGTVDITLEDETIRFKFKSSGTSKGVGVNGRDESYYYINGRLLKADADNKFDIYSCTFSDNGKVKYIGEKCSAQDVMNGPSDADYCVISATGTIVKSGTKKDGEGYRLTLKGYELVKVTTGSSSSDDKWEKGK